MGRRQLSHIRNIARTAIPRLVAIVETHGSKPERIMPKGSRCLKMKSQIGSDAKHHGWMAIQPIPKPAPTRQGAIFRNGQRSNVTVAALVKIAGRSVMQSVRTTPVIIRGQRQNADHSAGPVIRMTMRKKRAMAAIVLDHE